MIICNLGGIMTTYNQKMRNMLFKHMEFYQYRGFTVHNSAVRYADVLYKLKDSQKSYEKLYSEYLIYVMYLDAYKFSSYKQKECVAEDADIDFLGQLTDITDSIDLLAEVSANPDFLVKLIESCYKFHGINELGKVNIIKSLDSYENDWLEQRYPMHRQDLETYDIKITLQHLLKNIQNQIKYQQETLGIDFKEAIMTSITGFIRNLVKNDYDNAIDLLIEIAISDYVCSKTLLEKMEEDDLLIDHIDLYENYDKRDILNELIDNPNFLMSTIETIANVYVYGEYEGIAVKKEEIDENRGKSIMKKLKFTEM